MRILLTIAFAITVPSASFAQSAAPNAGNVAEASFERALTRAVESAFSPPGFPAEEEAALCPGQAPVNSPQTQPPPANPTAPSLGDLGLPPSATQANPQEQALLDKRTHMLKIHQRLGLITAIPLVATVITGGLAGGRSTSSTNRDLHAALGSVTAGLYFTTAYFSVFAPKVPGTRSRGQIRLHKALAWIHGPGMILTPVLGAMAFQEKSRGEKVHGIASAHGAVGVVTAAAFGLAIASVSFKF